jgi:hypothetical protein
MPSENVTRRDVEMSRDRPVAAATRDSALEQMADYNRLDALLARYGAETIVAWIGEIARDRRSRS